MSSVVLRSIASTHHDDGGGADLGSGPALDADMQHVLDRLKALEPRRHEHCTPEEARRQPGFDAALRAVLRDRPDETAVSMEMRMIHGPGGDIRARVYRPAADSAGLPMILYLHGGGFVVGDLESSAATPRALAARCRAVVVASHYRQAPESKFPAAFEDARAAWSWMGGQAESLGGDATRLAIVGEDAGANLAIDVALAAREGGGVRPRHLGLIAPMAGVVEEAADDETLPVGAATIRWYLKKLLRKGRTPDDPRLDPTQRDLGGLPPTTIILARHDPLRQGGERLTAALRRAGVWVDATTYDGVTHGFVGLARVVNKAMFAQGQLARNLNESLF